MAARYRVENRAGVLVEARVFWLGTAEDADDYAAAVRVAAQRCDGKRRPVLCADHRGANVYPPEVADRLLSAFKPNNGRFERIAILVAPENATLLMQLKRLTQQAGSESRKVLLDAAGALGHLRPALDDEERKRARAFLADETEASG